MPVYATLSLLAVLSFASGCSGGNHVEERGAAAPDLKAMALDHFPDTSGVSYTYNAPRTHVLVMRRNKQTAQQPLPITSYFVYEVAADSIVAGENAITGTVRWADDDHLLVTLTPGVVTGDPKTDAADRRYYVDVHTGMRSGRPGEKRP